MALALFGIFRWDPDNYDSPITEKSYTWLGWTYRMSNEKVRQFQNRNFNLYLYNPEPEGLGVSPDSLLKCTCNELRYHVNGISFPDKDQETAYTDGNLDRPSDLYPDWTHKEWRCYVKIIKAEIIKKSLKDLRKASDGKSPHPQGAQNRFIYLIE